MGDGKDDEISGKITGERNFTTGTRTVPGGRHRRLCLVKPYPIDYNEAGELIVDGAKMANDTFKGIGWCSAFLIGWFLEKRYVGFTTKLSME